MKQTENYIWNSFLNSGKKHLILTGTHRAGKTTRFQSFCEYLKEIYGDISLIECSGKNGARHLTVLWEGSV